MDFRVSEHGDLFVGQRALGAVGIVAEPIVCFVIALFSYLGFRIYAIQDMLRCRGVWEMFRVESA